MSNLYKNSSYVTDDKNTRIIDSNEAISAKIIEIRKAIKTSENRKTADGFVVGIDAKDVEVLIGEENENIDSEQENRVSMDIEYMLNNADMQAKSIVDKARYDAAMIIADAKKEAEEIKKVAKLEGAEQGYKEGSNKAKTEIDRVKEQMIQEQHSMEMEYKRLIENIEPQLVETILEVFAKVTNVISLDKKDIILSLVNSVMSGDDISNDYIIRVGSEDVKFLRDNKSRIEKMSRKDIHIEIVEDMSLKKNQCLIDTDLGIFDASLDIQLENLINDIKILSCMGKDV